MANLRAGDLVEVRSEEEILATLDARGALDALPFMPEMRDFCGQRLRVSKRADKTCDTIANTGLRRLRDTVHLEGLRCDGTSHGGCEARCLLFWKEAWLKPVSARPTAGRQPPATAASISACSTSALLRVTRAHSEVGEQFSCQATELRKATSPLALWDPRHFVRDLRSGNSTLFETLARVLFGLFTALLKIKGYRALMWTYNTICRLLGRAEYPHIAGTLTKTPTHRLDLQPGELVEVKTRAEILTTLDTQSRNRGLSFGVEMVPYCGRAFRVLAKVRQIVNEQSGRMMRLPNDCVILEEVVCQARYAKWGCPRAIYPYWREVWLRRVSTFPSGVDEPPTTAAGRQTS